MYFIILDITMIKIRYTNIQKVFFGGRGCLFVCLFVYFVGFFGVFLFGFFFFGGGGVFVLFGVFF